MIDYSYYQDLINSCRTAGILVDANILLLYLLGSVDRSQISRFKRTQQFAPEDYDTLCRFLKPFTKVITTAHILTEVSNLSGKLSEPLKSKYFSHFSDSLSVLQEEQRSSSVVSSEEAFIPFGLTDAAICKVATDGYLVLTDDFPLAKYLESKRIAVINFNHIRTLEWKN